MGERGVLKVHGTDGNDDIVVWQPLERVTRVEINGQVNDFNTRAVRRIFIHAGAGDDKVVLGRRAPGAKIRGGDGNDSLSGGDGNDRLYGDAGNDYLFGRDGDDKLDGGDGADDIYGGDGFDTVDYSRRTRSVRIGIGILPNDGEAGEGDNVRLDIEAAYGGSGDDKLRSWSDYGVRLYGGDGRDTIYGTKYADLLDGGAGADSYRHLDLGGLDSVLALDGEADQFVGGTGLATIHQDKVDWLRKG
jgi:Ca2+-binding RTX toxin-like protein